MPPNHESDQETRILQAIKAIHSNIFPSVRAAARAYDIPRSTLADRLRGQPTRQQSQIANRKLLPTEEEALLQWILSIGERGFPPRISAVREMANILFSARAESSVNALLTVSENWVRKFVNRYKQLQSKYTRKYDYQRALCENYKAMDNWFRLVKNTRAKYSIPRRNGVLNGGYKHRQSGYRVTKSRESIYNAARKSRMGYSCGSY